MTTESGADSEAKQQQENKESEKGNSKAAAAPTSPQNQPEQLPAAVGHSTPTRKEQVTQELLDEDQESQRSSTSRLSRSPLRGVKKVKIMQCKVTLLDGSEFTLNVEKRAKGQMLFDKVCDHLNLLEKDYFGITYRDVENQKNWLDPSKELKKQIRAGPWNFAFNVKFYPPDPSQLSEDITRYYLCLQLRDDVVSGRLPCSFATHTVLGSYTAQSELGDYDPDEMGSDYISELRFAPNQTKELEEKVVELHKTYKRMTPAEAEMHFLENAKKLSMYGVDLHHAKLVGSLYESLAPAEGEDSEGVEIMLGVCASGLLIYRDRLRINRFAWPKILKISYKRNNFYIKIRPGEFEQFESTIGFKLPNHRAAKRLWKVCVEHHTFFRLVSPEAPPKKFLSLGSKFRYSGRTQAQTRRASSQIIRPAPLFERSSSKRYNMSRSLDGAPIMENHESLMKDSAADGAAKVIAKGDTITTVTEKKAEEEKAEKEDAAQTPDAAVTTPLRADTKSEADEDSEMPTQEAETPTEVAKHQTNISELKRSFLESDTVMPGLTEWEKRLSSSPARSPRGDEAPMIEPLDVQDTGDGPETAEEKPKTIEAASYSVKYVMDSLLTEGPTSSGPHGISLSTTLDDDVFIDTTLRDVEEKTPDSEKVSPGAVRQEVSQAIIGKKGTLIILKDADDKAEPEDREPGEVLAALDTEAMENGLPSPEEDEYCLDEDASAEEAKTNGLPHHVIETISEEVIQIRVVHSPKKAMASWVSEAVKDGAAEVIGTMTNEVKEMKFEEKKTEFKTFKDGKMLVCESPAPSVDGSTLGWVSSSLSSTVLKTSADLKEKPAVASETEPVPAESTVTTSADAATKEIPVVHTETKTITYESSEADTNGDADPGVLLSAQTITSETTSTTTTTHITKMVKGGISETRIEKRIVITGDADIDHDEALAQAIKEAKEQHPDMSVTKVVVHKETEITPEEGED
ncbi:band 4.1-like protein 3b isoform X11 [Synchiropus splendidus]|uniref:band 4.1-like protein 3b isoform X11 n=1 Tax=Synchiropus splendidus TaxID=270530 RepID=UPI00237E3238|nr:band 4.1-like protein 3b isoform X11 [Synchiropus splendidus]